MDVTRRDFMKQAGIAGAAAAVFGCAPEAENTVGREKSPAPPGEDRTGTHSAGVPISIAGYSVPRVEELADGRVAVDRCAATFTEGKIGDHNTGQHEAKRLKVDHVIAEIRDEQTLRHLFGADHIPVEGAHDHLGAREDGRPAGRDGHVAAALDGTGFR